MGKEPGKDPGYRIPKVHGSFLLTYSILLRGPEMHASGYEVHGNHVETP
jgi:hypothetical protein